jgi:hypothetical protein
VTETPELTSFGDLGRDDVVRHPVWVSCHVADHDEPWHDDTDDETFRPFLGVLPVDPRSGMFLVAANATLAAGTSLSVFITPSIVEGDVGALQPQGFVGDRTFGLWGGMLGVAESYRNALYDVLGTTESDVSPLRPWQFPTWHWE